MADPSENEDRLQTPGGARSASDKPAGPRRGCSGEGRRRARPAAPRLQRTRSLAFGTPRLTRASSRRRAPGRPQGNSWEARSPRVAWGGVRGIPKRGSTRWEKRDVPSEGARSRLSGAVLLPRGPRPGGVPPPGARGCGGETPRPPGSPAPPPRPPGSRQPPAAFGPSVSFTGPAPSAPGKGRKLWRWFPHAGGRKSPR